MVNYEHVFWIGAGENESVSRHGLVPILLSQNNALVWVGPAENRFTSPEDLRLLSKFEPPLRTIESKRVSLIIATRGAVAANPNTDKETLAYLLNMNNKGPLGLNDAWNGSRDQCSGSAFPVDMLAKGVRDRVDLERVFSATKSAGHRSILARHSKNKETLASLVGADNGTLDEFLAENKFTPTDALTELSESANARARAALARNRSAPSEVLSALSNDETVGVRAAIVENPAVTEQVLGEMYSDIANVDGKALIVNHENFSKRIRNDFMASAVQDGVLVDPTHSMDQILFRWRDELPEDLLIAASRGTHLLRLCVASNPRLPIESVARLCNDDSVALPYQSYGGLINNPLVQLAADDLSRGLSIDGVVSGGFTEK